MIVDAALRLANRQAPTAARIVRSSARRPGSSGAGTRVVSVRTCTAVTATVRASESLLREQVRLLGANLGQTLRTSVGDWLFDLVEAIRRAGPNPGPEKILHALETLGNLDVGGFNVSFSPNSRVGSRFVEVTVIGRNGTLLR